MFVRLFVCLVVILQAVILSVVDCTALPASSHRNRHVDQLTERNRAAQGQDRVELLASPSLGGHVDVRQLRLPGETSTDQLASGSHRRRVGHPEDKNEAVPICTLCPLPQEIYPCKCSCANGTTAELNCGSDLVSCTQLTDILSVTSFPSTHYYRLMVDDTKLSCSIQEDMWGPLKFQEIIMMDNEFQTVDNHAFIPFSNTLKLLNLVRNSLKNVFFPTLSDQPYLQTLLLDHNEISFIPGYTVMALPYLRTLTIAHNNMFQIQPYTFAGLPSLELLDLSHNSITKLYQGSLTIPDHQAPDFTIDLSYNAITYIEPGVMEGVKGCKIRLQHNQLTSLPENVYRPIIDLTRASAQLLVAGNPFDCNAYFCWIATNATVSECFDQFRCPNLGNETVECIKPQCPNEKRTGQQTRGHRQATTTRRQETRPSGRQDGHKR
ncbi:uncharacterized protein [Panulirus ornatus]|uniref:uncharacterized protein n=1 Tax=Panulirus ornatus TaxID=150431 RepID=UPI003A8785CB